jgi:8-oxo-dGTP pyrophosphatase MutT (NUDIX family)
VNLLATIGQFDASLQYVDRLTVKVIIRKDGKFLILNKGLLPGGGVDSGESDNEAITRELQEELGVTVRNVHEVGTVVQYRSLLGKKYIINGYIATLDTTNNLTNPQDNGEAQFIMRWLELENALVHVSKSIEDTKQKPMDNDANQGELYNLMTTYKFLKAL